MKNFLRIARLKKIYGTLIKNVCSSTFVQIFSKVSQVPKKQKLSRKLRHIASLTLFSLKFQNILKCAYSTVVFTKIFILYGK